MKTRNGSCVTAKIAGIESTANTMSLTSMSTSTVSNGVARSRPSMRTQNFEPW